METKRDQSIEAAGLQVRFRWGGDRWVHEILRRDGDAWSCKLASVEGSPEEDWPASPPLQSLEIDARGEAAAALLVGMAGKSHWSASIAIDAQTRCVRFDVACRVRGQAGPLGSTYRQDAAGLDLALDAQAPFAPARLERTGEIVRVAVDASPGTEARTIRWQYRVISASAQA